MDEVMEIQGCDGNATYGTLLVTGVFAMRWMGLEWLSTLFSTISTLQNISELFV